MKLSLQQKVLWYWAVYKDDTAVVSYSKDITGTKRLSKVLKQEDEMRLLNDFYKDPKEVLAYCRTALQRIAKDENLWVMERFERSERYIGQYLDLIIKLDAEAFAHDPQKIYKWIPDYIPDGFVDMWADKVLDTDRRHGREKIIINKKQIFYEEKELLYKILSSPSMTKKDMISNIFYVVANKEYNYDVANNILWGQSIQMHDIIKKQLLICRHKALLFQILAQTCWLTSRLLKCDVVYPNGWWSHVANLIRLDYKRYLLDATAWTRIINGKKMYYIVPIPEQEIDLNKNTYKREIKNDNGIMHEYISRNNAYYQVR